jgi:hypothetical protein
MTVTTQSRAAHVARAIYDAHGRDGSCDQAESRALAQRHGLSHPGMNGGLYGGRYPWLERRGGDRRFLTPHALRRLGGR